MKELSKTERTLSARDFGKEFKTPEDVAMQVKEDFRLRGMSLADAARRLGVFRQGVSLQLSGKSYLSKIASEAYNRVFGFSRDFLRSGYGYMYDDVDLNDIFLGDSDSDYELAVKIRERERFVENLKNKELEELRRQYTELNYSYGSLEKDYKELQRKYNDLSAALVRIVVRDQGAIEAVRPPFDGEREIPESSFAETVYQFLISQKRPSPESNQVPEEPGEDI